MAVPGILLAIVMLEPLGAESLQVRVVMVMVMVMVSEVVSSWLLVVVGL